MRLLLLWITLTALLQHIAAQNWGNNFQITNESEYEPFHRCLGCDPCKDYEDGKDENGKGTRVCSTDEDQLDGCVSMFMSVLIRKCVSDMNMEDISHCKKNEDLCVSCYSPNCNIHNFTAYVDLTGGSSAFRTSFLLFSICLIVWLVISE